MMTASAPPNCVSPALLFGNETGRSTLEEAEGRVGRLCFCALLESQE